MNWFQRHHHLRPVTPEDKPSLQTFLRKTIYLHQHLDWRNALDWVGWQPFWLAEKDSQIIGFLASPADPPLASWIRIFAADLFVSPSRVLVELLEKNVEWHREYGKVSFIASLGLSDWFSHLLQDSGFHHHQDVVMMTYDLNFVSCQTPLLRDGIIREMGFEDLPLVTAIDHAAFEPLWQLSQIDLSNAFQKCTYKTVLEVNGKLVAYQMSTESESKAHLARLAVSPEMQNKGLGAALIRDLLEHFILHKGLQSVTLNTQSTNAASLHVHQRCGFHLTGEQFPVFILPLY